MIKKCPKCGSDKLRWNSSHISCTCKECGYLWKRNRKGLTFISREDKVKP